MKKFLKDEGGQVIVDYLLTLSLVVFVVTILATGFRKSLFALWEVLTKEISAACPGCSTDPRLRLR